MNKKEASKIVDKYVYSAGLSVETMLEAINKLYPYLYASLK